jgi:signal transduction histidine kinase
MHTEVAEREQQRLRELEQMKDEFLSTAAHELRTPLTSIRMSAGIVHEQMKLLVEGATGGNATHVDPRLIDLIGLVLEGSQRMHSLVNDLLDLTRLEQGRASLVMEDIDMRDVVKAAVATTHPLFESKGQTLLVSMPESHFPVHGDAARLEQVLINLLSNANKYTPEGATTHVRVFRSGAECVVAVRDNGPGVPEGEYELIFDRFFRSSAHRSDRTASTGLGLPIARKIAEMHKGRLAAEPAPGGGSIFTLALPIVG